MPMTTDQARPPSIEPLPEGELEVITTHVNADFDAVASMIASSKLYPGAVMVFPGSQEKNLRNFYIQSMMYLFNVVRVKDVRMGDVRRLILVDTRQPQRIGQLAGILDNPGLSVHVYDHHPDAPGDIKGEVEIVQPVGATVTVLTEILTQLNVPLSPEEATVMAMGIYEDTGSFTFRSTTPRDYISAARLLEKGADLNVVSEMISRELTVDQLNLLNELLESSQTHIINGVELAIASATSEQYIDELAVLVHKIMDMNSIHVMFALASMDGRIYLVARSRIPQVDVSEITSLMGGGGHPSAAAATVKGLTLPQASSKLLQVLNRVLGPVRTAKDIMAYPVISVKPDSTLTEARTALVRYDINVLLVSDDEDKVIGYISRQNVAKALYHGLPGYPVSEFMNPEFGVVGPDATFAEIQALIVDQKQRVVPVTVDGRAVGVITRTDLLNILASEANVPGSLIEGAADYKTGRTKKILNLMRERLPRDVLDLLADIGRTADRLEFGAYAVGGFVRDLFLRQDNLDIDVVIEGDAIRFAEVFARAHDGVRVRHHRKFNTSVLIFPENYKVDVTTARLEYYEEPGALPVVEGGSIRLDLYRRDFTINTLAIRLNESDFGMVIDYFRGLKDIKDGYVRVLHNLSFVEDPTRVFRAIRFEQRFGFKIGKLTLNLIQNAVKHDFFLKLSGKRLAGEVRLILREDNPASALARMDDLDLLKFIHPSLKFDRSMAELFGRIKKVQAWFDLTYLDEAYEAWLVYFLALINVLDKTAVSDCCRRLSLLKKERQVLLEEKLQAHKALGHINRKRNARPSDVHILLNGLSTETILFMMAKTTRDETIRLLSSYFTTLKHVKPELTGEDLIAMGLEPGPQFKNILNELQKARLDGEVSSRSEEEALVRSKFIPAEKK